MARGWRLPVLEGIGYATSTQSRKKLISNPKEKFFNSSLLPNLAGPFRWAFHRVRRMRCQRHQHLSRVRILCAKLESVVLSDLPFRSQRHNRLNVDGKSVAMTLRVSLYPQTSFCNPMHHLPATGRIYIRPRSDMRDEDSMQPTQPLSASRSRLKLRLRSRSRSRAGDASLAVSSQSTTVQHVVSRIPFRDARATRGFPVPS